MTHFRPSFKRWPENAFFASKNTFSGHLLKLALVARHLTCLGDYQLAKASILMDQANRDLQERLICLQLRWGLVKPLGELASWMCASQALSSPVREEPTGCLPSSPRAQPRAQGPSFQTVRAAAGHRCLSKHALGRSLGGGRFASSVQVRFQQCPVEAGDCMRAIKFTNMSR